MYSPDNRHCPLVEHEIESEICYETVMCLTAGFKITSVPEMEVKNVEQAKRICDKCPYSNLE